MIQIKALADTMEDLKKQAMLCNNSRLDAIGNNMPTTADFYLKKQISFNLAAEILEKQIPKKIVVNKPEGQNAFCVPYRCPDCDADQIKTEFVNAVDEKAPKTTFCWSCGQKLDWEGCE